MEFWTIVAFAVPFLDFEKLSDGADREQLAKCSLDLVEIVGGRSIAIVARKAADPAQIAKCLLDLVEVAVVSDVTTIAMLESMFLKFP